MKGIARASTWFALSRSNKKKQTKPDSHSKSHPTRQAEESNPSSFTNKKRLQGNDLVYAFPSKWEKTNQPRFACNLIHSTSQGIEPQLLHKNERDCTLSRFKMRKNKPDFDSCRFVNGLRFSNIKMRKQTLSDRAFKSHPLNKPRTWTPARPQKRKRLQGDDLVCIFPDQTPLLFIPSLSTRQGIEPKRVHKKMKEIARPCKLVYVFPIEKEKKKKQTDPTIPSPQHAEELNPS